MDWLSDFTKNWKLKNSFLLYMAASLILSIPLGFICQLIIYEIKKQYLLTKVLSQSNTVLDRFMYSNFLAIFIDFIPVLIITAFFFVFFNLFYKHKIQNVLMFLDKGNEIDLRDKNELSIKAYEVIFEKEKLLKDNFIHIRNTNDILKERDTILHEIKNPLTILSGDIELLKTLYNIDDEKFNQILNRMTRSERRIQGYINNLEQIENIKALELDIRKINFEKFVNTIHKELNHWKNKILFNCDLKDLTKLIEIDLEIFLEGFINIIKNADTHAKSKVIVDIYENDKYLIVNVKDDGPGFSQDALNNYNKPYFSENPLVGNMGLGLYITDEIMKKLDIKMELNNNSGANVKLFIQKS